jgi:protein-tyrosine phosphatase
MQGFIDLHCHYLPAVDDGVKTAEDGRALLLALRGIGFAHVVATPHMRPALWDNQAPALREAYAAFASSVQGRPEFPTTALSAEHFFDDVTYGRLARGEGLPYEKGRTVLVEFPYESLPVGLAARFFDLRMKRLRPVVAHPERYEPFWKGPEKAAESMRRAGGVLLLDVAALVGKYGSRAQRAAEELVRCAAYYGACSDAHRPGDVDEVAGGIARLRALAGDDELRRLLVTGPGEILAGRVFDAFD